MDYKVTQSSFDRRLIGLYADEWALYHPRHGFKLNEHGYALAYDTAQEAEQALAVLRNVGAVSED